jgi:hypothetical protein
MATIVGAAVSLVFVSGCLMALWAILRFSVVSPVRMEALKGRLRHPDAEGVAEVCGFPVPAALVTLYLEAPFIELVEFDLIDTSQSPGRVRRIGAFKPLVGSVIEEWRTITGNRELPIADDQDKGVYYVTRDGKVMLASPNLPGGSLLVASSIEAFGRFGIGREP